MRVGQALVVVVFFGCTARFTPTSPDPLPGTPDADVPPPPPPPPQVDGGSTPRIDAGVRADSGVVHTPDAGTTPGLDAGPVQAAGWLHTAGNHILTADGHVWHGRGANLHDTRSCNACTWSAPDVNEVKRRVDALVAWKANFIRLDLESYATADGRTHWQGILDDPSYLADVTEIVRYIGTKPGVYVLVSLWTDPTFSPEGWPTAATAAVWTKLAQVFRDSPHVLYGLVNEPQNNYDGSSDPAVWKAMNDTVTAIRTAEAARPDLPNHIVAVQGTGGWARFLAYYVTHPISAGGGANVAYEVHVYDAASTFADRFETPGKTLPVIVGEFGPASGYMTEADCTSLMQRAEAAEVPYLSWTFHMRCDPNLLVDNSQGGCGVGMTLAPTSWGTLLESRLQAPF